MSGRRRRRAQAGTTAIWVAVGATLLDWLSKVFAATTLDDRAVPVAGWLSLRLGHNPGIAFGLGDRLPALAVIALTGAVTAGIALAVLRNLLPSPVGAGLILGGAVGNLGDRVLGGSVVDFIDLTWWPSFNLADVFLTIGVLWSTLSSMRETDGTTAPPHHHRCSTSCITSGPRAQ